MSKSTKRQTRHTVILLNPVTCGIYKKGATRYKVDHTTGRRLPEIDNELGEHVSQYLAGQPPPGSVAVSIDEAFNRGILVPRYYDERWSNEFRSFVARERLQQISLGDLTDSGVITVGGGHGSPSNDMRGGHIPYIKVSDVRSLRINVNPTNRVSRGVAEIYWGRSDSGLEAWDLITPNRASSNIGEFAVLLPGEEERLLTKEFFVLRVLGGEDQGWDWAYLLWALCLRAVRKQWQRVALMQTNREDVGDRWREILVPVPKDKQWARTAAGPFREYFTAIAESRNKFLQQVAVSRFDYIASVSSVEDLPPDESELSGELAL